MKVVWIIWKVTVGYEHHGETLVAVYGNRDAAHEHLCSGPSDPRCRFEMTEEEIHERYE